MTDNEVPGPTRRSRKRIVKQGSPEHIEIVRAPLLSQIKQLEQGRECLKADLAEVREELSKACENVRHADKKASDADRIAHGLLEENNSLRSRLFASEMAYAKLRGYLDRVEDERPPAMVPQAQARFADNIPDGSAGTSMNGIRSFDGRSEKAWFHR